MFPTAYPPIDYSYVHRLGFKSPLWSFSAEQNRGVVHNSFFGREECHGPWPVAHDLALGSSAGGLTASGDINNCGTPLWDPLWGLLPANIDILRVEWGDKGIRGEKERTIQTIHLPAKTVSRACRFFCRLTILDTALISGHIYILPTRILQHLRNQDSRW